jgi:hypothetical protein
MEAAASISDGSAKRAGMVARELLERDRLAPEDIPYVRRELLAATPSVSRKQVEHLIGIGPARSCGQHLGARLLVRLGDIADFPA